MKTELLPGGIRLLQSDRHLKLGADAILLAAFCPQAERICEPGCGVGGVLLALAGRQPDATLTGVEINPDAAALCRESIALNALEDRVEVLTADLRELSVAGGTPTRLAACGEAADGAAAAQALHATTAERAEQGTDASDTDSAAAPSVGRSGASPASAAPALPPLRRGAPSELPLGRAPSARGCVLPRAFDLVVMNPPYLRAGTVRESPDATRNLERIDRTATPRDVASAAERLLKVGGELCLVLRVDRLDDYLAALAEASLEPRELRLVAHTPSHPPSLALLRAEKGCGGSPHLGASAEAADGAAEQRSAEPHTAAAAPPARSSASLAATSPTLYLANADGSPSAEYARILEGGRL